MHQVCERGERGGVPEAAGAIRCWRGRRPGSRLPPICPELSVWRPSAGRPGVVGAGALPRRRRLATPARMSAAGPAAAAAEIDAGARSNIEDFFLRPAVSVLLLFASLPDYSQNQTAVSDALRLLSDF